MRQQFTLEFYLLADKRQMQLITAYSVIYLWSLVLLVAAMLTYLSISMLVVLNAFAFLALTSLASRSKITYTNHQRTYLFILWCGIVKSVLFVLIPILAYVLHWEMSYLGGYILLIMNALIEIFFIIMGIKISTTTMDIVVWCEENLGLPHGLL